MVAPTRVAITGGVALVVCLFGGACGADEESIPISGNVLTVGPTEFEVTLGCYENVRVEVDEGPERVGLRGYGEGPIGGDCASTATISLDDPLADRLLIDGTTGRNIKVTPGDG